MFISTALVFAHSKSLQAAEWSSMILFFALVKWEYKLMFVPKMFWIAWGWSSSQTMHSRMKHQNSFTAFPASWKYTPQSSTNGTRKWSNFFAESVADFQVKHDPIHIHQLRCLAISWMMTQTFTNGEWLEITIRIHEQNWLFSHQTFQIPKMEVQKPIVFSGVYCWKPCWIKQDLKGYTTNKTPTDLKRRSFQENKISDANCESWSHWISDRALKRKDVLPTSFNRVVGQPEGI